MGNRSKLRSLFEWLRGWLVFNPLIYLYTIVLGTLSLLSSLFDRSGRVQHGFARLWSWLILKTAFAPVEVIGLDRLDTSRPYVYACNHASALDIPVLYVQLRFPFRIMAKKELFRYPFMGWHLQRSGQIAIDSSSALASMRSLNRAIDSLKSGMPLVVFPEGGRSPNGRIQPFLAGAFYAAIKAHVDVVPLAVVGTFELLPMNTYTIRPRRLQLLAGDPISIAGFSQRDMEKLAAHTQKAIEDLYYSRAEVKPPDASVSSVSSVVRIDS